MKTNNNIDHFEKGSLSKFNTHLSKYSLDDFFANVDKSNKSKFIFFLTEAQVINIKEWLVALRSGNYNQGPGWLCNNNIYCCLGIYCDIKNELKPVPDTTWYITNHIDSTGVPSHEWFEEDTGFTTTFWRLNDDDHMSFFDIADFIEYLLTKATIKN